MQFRRLFFLFIYWLAFNAIVFYPPITFFPEPDVTAISEVEYTKSNATMPLLVENKNWQTITLPDDWYENHENAKQLWYRANVFIENKESGIWGIYLPSVTHNAAVYINDLWVGQGGKFTKPLSRHHNDPLLFRFSSELLQIGKNEIKIRVQTTYSKQGLFDKFYLAPVELLNEAYQWKHFIRVDLVQWFTTSIYIFSLMLLVFWIARPQDTIYILFAVVMFIWATHNLNLLVTNIPVPAHIWEALGVATLSWFVTAMIFFNHRFIGSKNILVEKIVLSISIVGLGIFFLPDVESVLQFRFKVLGPFTLTFGAYAIYHLLKVYIKDNSFDVYLMIVVGIPILVSGFHDILMLNHFIDRREGLTIQYSIIPAALLFIWFLVRRFVNSINEAEDLAETLEQRVKVKEQQLQSQYKRLTTMQREHVLSEERERIMRDMHDGIGGQLVSVITLLQDTTNEVFINIRDKVQHSLTDLRFVIDSLDPLLNDLPTLLGMMRVRFIDQLNASDIKLNWEITELPEINNMSPRRSLHIMRIVQEAINNVVKHSSTNEMTVATGISSKSNDQIYIDVIDFGQGMEATSSHKSVHSRGISNMKYRASQLNAILTIKSSNKGTQIRLTLNLD